MASKTIQERVIEIVCEQLAVNPDQVYPTSSFLGVLGVDSIDTIELLTSIEEGF